MTVSVLWCMVDEMTKTLKTVFMAKHCKFYRNITNGTFLVINQSLIIIHEKAETSHTILKFEDIITPVIRTMKIPN